MSSKLGVMDEEMEGEASELIFLYLFNFFMFFFYKGEQADLGRCRGLWRWEVQQINYELLPLVGIMKTFLRWCKKKIFTSLNLRRWARHQKYLWDLIEKPDTSPAAKWMSYIRLNKLFANKATTFAQHDVRGDLNSGDVPQHYARLPAHRPQR